MQFLNKLSTAILPNRVLIQRATLLNETQQLTIQHLVRGVVNRSSDKEEILSGIPEKPKRPIGAFFRYIKLVEPKVIHQHPNAKRKEIIKIIGEMWKNVDEETHVKLKNEYLKEVELYGEKIQQYESKLTEEQKETLEEKNLNEKKAKIHRKLKKQNKELGKPKRPPNAYLLFAQSKKSNDMLGGKLTDWSIKVGQEWKNLSPEQKKVYIDKAKDLSDKYQSDLFDWESKMDDLGHTKLLHKDKITKKSKSSTKSKSENMEDDKGLLNSTENVICSLSKADKKENKTTTSNISSEKGYDCLSSPSYKSSSNNNSKNVSNPKRTEDNFSSDEINLKSKNKFSNKLLFYLDLYTYLSDKRTVHIAIGVTFFSVFVVLPLFYFLC